MQATARYEEADLDRPTVRMLLSEIRLGQQERESFLDNEQEISE